MRITIAAIGRLKAGAERMLFDRFVERAGKNGRSIGLVFRLREFAEAPGSNPARRKADEAARLLTALPSNGRLVALDEGGTALDSLGFARILADWRDSGTEDLVIAIGGPDGLDPAIIERAHLRLAFGRMTWPHQLVRLMLAEQLYRAVTILTGHPYHRG